MKPVLLVRSSGATCGGFTDMDYARAVVQKYAHEIPETNLNDYEAIVVSAFCDQRALSACARQISDYLDQDGLLVFNGHIAYPLLPELPRFVPQPGFGVELLRVSQVQPHPVFEGVDMHDLTFRQGVAGFYARGHNPPPHGAVVLNQLGNNNVPVDWIWQRPGGGEVFMHGGIDMWVYAQDDTSAARIAPQLLQWIDQRSKTHPAAKNAPRIAAVDGGSYYHRITLEDTRFAGYFNRIIPTHELASRADEWMDCDALFIMSRQHPQTLQAAQPQIEAFLAQGKTVVCFGPGVEEQWLAGVQWHPCETNFWWWLTPGADSGLRQMSSEHSMFKHITLADATWHQHGYLDVPAGATSLINRQGEGSILYEDKTSTAGRLVISTLDPCFHHGSNFMPTTTRFLKGFLSWLTETLQQDKNRTKQP